MEKNTEITKLLIDASNGNRVALEELFPLVYDELRRLARNYMWHERKNHTLQPTALVHEAYMRLLSQHSVDWQNRVHFFGIAAEMMRRVLIKYAEQRRTFKHGIPRLSITLDEAIESLAAQNIDLLNLHEALLKLAEIDPLQSRIVELKFFGGMTIEEIAVVVKVSPATVKREWRMAKAWLHHQLTGDVE